MLDAEIMALLGIAFGVIFRMAVPFLRKKAELPEGEKRDAFTWESKYTYAGILAVIVAISTTFIGFLAFPIPESVSSLSFFIVAMVYGFGLDGFIVEVMNWAYE